MEFFEIKNKDFLSDLDHAFVGASIFTPKLMTATSSLAKVLDEMNEGIYNYDQISLYEELLDIFANLEDSTDKVLEELEFLGIEK
jgi:hypothetical protein